MVDNLLHSAASGNVVDANLSDEALVLIESLEYFRPFLGHMNEILRLIAKGPTESVVDYGCGPGAWSLCARRHFGTVYGIDISPQPLAQFRRLIDLNEVTGIEVINADETPVSELPQVSAMFSVDVMPVMRSNHIREMFDFARAKLIDGGLFLCTTRRAPGLLDFIVTLERFKWEGIFGGFRRYAAMSRSAVEAYVRRRVTATDRARFFHHPDAIIRLATANGFTVVSRPEELASGDPFVGMEPLFTSRPYEAQLARHIDWYVFRKEADR